MDIKYDPILGKLRERDIGGGTSGGGGDLIAGAGINSVALENGTISTVTATADELVSGTTATKLVTANAYKTLNRAEPVVFGGSTASLAANTEFEFCDDVHLKKDEAVQVYFEFTGDFGNFDIIHGYGEGLNGRMLRITPTTIELHTASGITYTYNHGLTITTFLNVDIQTRFSYYNNGRAPLATVTLTTLSGSYTKYDFYPLLNYGNYSVVSSFAVSNLVANYIAMDVRKRIWVFGDSYVEFVSNGWPTFLPFNLMDDIAFFGFSGAKSLQLVSNLQTFIAKSRPDYVVWSLGMNDRDTESSYNANWKSALDQVEQICSANAVQLVLVAIPNTPTYNNTLKNAYIHSLSYPVIDFAKAVNADTAGATWYTGMLKNDNLHPTEIGAKKLSDAFTQYFAESFYFSNAGVVANELTPELMNFVKSISAGYGIDTTGGTVSQKRWLPIETVSGRTVTLMAGHAYKAYATTSSLTVNTETIPADSYGLEGHLAVFVGKTGYVVTASNVVLKDALEPDAVNNCTIRFHDGYAIISVEDHIAGYIVVNATGTADGSLYYGLATSTQEYISVSISLDGQTLDMGGATTNKVKHVVGNGYDKTTVTGNINGTNNVTFSNLSMDGVTVLGGTMTLGDVYIPQGGTVSVNGGKLAIEKLAGNSSLIDLGKTFIDSAGIVSGVIITNGNGSTCGALRNPNGVVIDCVISGNTSGNTAGGILIDNNKPSVSISGCTITGNRAAGNIGGGIANYCKRASGGIVIDTCLISGNTASYGADMVLISGGYASIKDSDVGIVMFQGGTTGEIDLLGSNRIGRIYSRGSTHLGTVSIASGAIVDLTDNANTSPIDPGVGIIVTGGCTVINSAGVSVAINGGTYTKINKDGTTA